MPAEHNPPTIVVCDDGSATAADALALAKVLAPAFGARLVLEGEASARRLHELAGECGAALVVLGAGGRSAHGRVRPGSATTRLLHGAPCGVAIAPRGYAAEAREPRVIEVAFDLSPESEVALRKAVEIALAVGATVRVVAVIDPVEYGYGPVLGGYQVVAAESLRRRLEERTRELVDELPSELRADARVVRGNVASNILGEAEKGVDLLVMGSRGYGPVPSVLLGSVSSRVLASAPCPVLVVPRSARTATERRPGHAASVR